MKLLITFWNLALDTKTLDFVVKPVNHTLIITSAECVYKG